MEQPLIFDRAVNFWECIADLYDLDEYSYSPSINLVNPSTGNERMILGSAWNTVGSILRSAIHLRNDPDGKYIYAGFQCARNP
jgi:formylglycine-generating enzyme required for sulfatase activity